MAINMNDKKYLSQNILPQIDFNITSIGITLMSDRLSMPRLIPYDLGGKCRECKSTETELDFIVTKEGATIYCNRIKGPRFVPFDAIYEFPGHCFFRVKNKGRVFNVPHGAPYTKNCPELPAPPLPQQEKIAEPIAPQAKQTPGENGDLDAELQRFYDSLSAATTYMDHSAGTQPQPQQPILASPPKVQPLQPEMAAPPPAAQPLLEAPMPAQPMVEDPMPAQPMVEDPMPAQPMVEAPMPAVEEKKEEEKKKDATESTPII